MFEVTAAIIKQDDKYLICQRAIDDDCPLLWEFPGGKLEPGETLEECIIREIEEELNISIEVTDVFEKTIYRFNDREVHFTFFKCKILDGEMVIRVHNAIKWASLNEMKDIEFMPADIPIVERLIISTNSSKEEGRVMGFYEAISKYYDYIFPTGKEQLTFIRKVAGNPPKSLLDVACGTGGYSIELSKSGYDMTATDIDAKMIDELNDKLLGGGNKVNAIQVGMLELNEKLNIKYDVVFCIGNSIVHLDTKEEIYTFLQNSKQLLKNEGSLILQIINFDRILGNNISSLPTIINDEINLKFERYYNYNKDKNKIYFRTILKVNNFNIENEIPLYPLMSLDVIDMLTQSGFRNIKMFGDFSGNKYEKNSSFMLIVVAS